MTATTERTSRVSEGARSIAGPLAARILTYPVSIACSLVTAGLLIQASSVGTYAAYTLTASLLPFLAFMDLGYGGALTNWAAEYSSSMTRVARSKLENRMARALRGAGLPIVVGIAIAIFLLFWSVQSDGHLLDMPGSSVAVALGVYCIGIPFSIVSKILIGIGSTVTWILVQLVQPVASLALVCLSLAIGQIGIVPIIPSLSLFAMCGVGAFIGLKSTGLRLEFRTIFRPRLAGPRDSLFASAWPMMIILVANPLALSSDRLLLTWFSGTSEVASYSLGAQLFAPALALLSATGLSLWPYFAKKHFSGETTGPWPMVAMFTLAACAGSGALIWMSPLATIFVGADKIELPFVLLTCLASAFVVQAAQLPIGMFMMQGSGPLIQALLLTMMFMVKFGLTALLLPVFGAGGPVLATAIAILVCQIGPGAVIILRKAI